ncbi:MAG: GAF domain-containing protein [Proteobacteria bacterium]|nr:GAF domain-containing protein [Pseudomonadota bacterium]MBU2618565.1 GAF domain-containing protein [Pseudomonadota bacterium]
MKIRSKLILIGIIPVALLLTLSALFLWATGQVERATHKAIVADELAATLADLAILTYEHHIYFEERAHVQWVEKHAFLERQIKAETALFDSAGEQELLGRLSRTVHNLGFLFAQYGPHPSHGKGMQLSGQEKSFHDRLTARILQDLAVAAPAAHALHHLNHDRSLAFSRRIEMAGVLVVGAIAVLLLLLSSLIIRSFSLPVRVLTEAFAAVSAGDLGCRIGSAAKDELGNLSRGFDAMAQRLQESNLAVHSLNLELEARVEDRTRDLSRANAELRLNEERLALLLALSQREFDTEEELIRYALEETVRLARSTVGYLHFFNEDQQTLRLFLWSEAVMELCTAVKTPHYPLQAAGIWADCVRQRQPVVHNDYQNMAGKKGLPEGHFPLFRHLSIPIFDGENIVAVLGVGNKEEPYDADDIRQLTLYMGSAWEMVRRKRVETLLHESEQRYRAIFNESPDGILIIDLETGKAVEFNDVAHRQLGYGREEFAGLSLADYEARERPEEIQAHIEKIRRHESDSFETEHRTKSGEIRNVAVSAQILILGERQYLYTIFRDITELRQAQEGLRQYAESLARSNTELEHFAYVASHDLQEPLRKIGSFTELLARKYQGHLDEKADAYIGYIVDGAQRLQTLINDLLAFSRVTTKGKEFEPVDCNALLARVRQDLELAIKESGARLSAGNLPTVMADAGQLGQVFQNLITNAVKYRAAGQAPEIAVAAVERDAEWLFSVRDSGIGIEPQHFERVFQLFQRLHTREEYSGTGIGLALCKKIVERHGGKIWLESAAGKGTTFFFTVPRMPMQQKTR